MPINHKTTCLPYSIATVKPFTKKTLHRILLAGTVIAHYHVSCFEIRRTKMITKWKKFDISVIVIVTLTGAGFGVFAGLLYTDDYSWTGSMAGIVDSIYVWSGLITGTVSGYLLARWYLKLLMKMSIKGYNKKLTWFLSTLIAILCGIICTTLIHGLMILTKLSDIQWFDQDGMFPIFITVCEIVGASAGLIVGSISSLIYVLARKN